MQKVGSFIIVYDIRRWISQSSRIFLQAEDTMLEITEGGEKHSLDPYIKLLRAEPIFKEEESLQSILCELVTLAVHDGQYYVSVFNFS